MSRTATVKLDGQDYTVHALNMKELQEVMEIVSAANGNNSVSGMKILEIGMRRCKPPIENFNDLEPTLAELGEATAILLKLSGMDISPPMAAPAK